MRNGPNKRGHKQIAEGDWNRMPSRGSTERLCLRGSRDYQEGFKHFKEC